MRRAALLLAAWAAASIAASLLAQQDNPNAPSHSPPASAQSVPRLILLAGTMKDLVGQPLTGPVDLHFSIYKEQADAAPLWQETQTLQLDEQGHYTVLLGGMQPNGLPLELFTTGEARWLGVAVGTLPEKPRTLLVSVPYALKANDAEMLGGKPASAYMLVPPAENATTAGTATTGGAEPGVPAPPAPANLKPGKSGASPKPYATPIATNYIPVFTSDGGALGSSVMYQSGSNIGVGTPSPLATLDVNGIARVAYTGYGGLTLTGSQQSSMLLTNAAGAGGFSIGRSLTSDNGQNFFVYDRAAGATRLFVNRSGNVGVGTTNPQTTLHVNGKALVSYTGTAGLTLTGSLQSSLVLTNAAGGPGFQLGRALYSNNNQDFFVWDNVANAPRIFIDGGGNVGIGTLSPAARLDVAGNINSSGNVTLPQTTDASAGVLNLGGSPFLHACCSATQFNTFVGTNAGSFTTTGDGNAALGYEALYSNADGSANSASGYSALYSNTSGTDNTADGNGALYFNTTGSFNTASGVAALYANTTASFNTAVGYYAGMSSDAEYANSAGSNNTFLGALSGPGTSTPLNNATAIGYQALVSADNSLVLGGTGSYAVNVGIGTETPAVTLDVVGDVRASGCVIASGATLGGTCSSDARLKTNIQPFSPVLAKLAQLQPVYFHWRSAAYPKYHFGSGTKSGLIAQEVEKVFPELVSADAKGFKLVNYGELPFLMLQAIRELKAENDRLRAEKEEIQRQITALEARLARLENAGKYTQAAPNEESASQKASVGSALANHCN